MIESLKQYIFCVKLCRSTELHLLVPYPPDSPRTTDVGSSTPYRLGPPPQSTNWPYLHPPAIPQQCAASEIPACRMVAPPLYGCCGNMGVVNTDTATNVYKRLPHTTGTPHVEGKPWYHHGDAQ